jgi:hypothetical protein
VRWNHTVPDLAAVEILVTDNDDWKAWVFTFSNAHGDKATLSLRSEGQATSLIAGFTGTTAKKAISLIAGFGINRNRKLKKKNNHKEDKQSKQKKSCLKKGCTNYVAKHFTNTATTASFRARKNPLRRTTLLKRLCLKFPHQFVRKITSARSTISSAKWLRSVMSGTRANVKLSSQMQTLSLLM